MEMRNAEVLCSLWVMLVHSLKDNEAGQYLNDPKASAMLIEKLLRMDANGECVECFDIISSWKLFALLTESLTHAFCSLEEQRKPKRGWFGWGGQ